MMMQMLEAGGMSILTDGVRGPDRFNPWGYYELDRVKDLNRDVSWLRDAEGCAVKVISALLCRLPPGREYKVIFMRRDIDTVYASQARMLGEELTGAASEREMKAHLRRHLDRVRRRADERGDMDVLPCPYEGVVGNPEVWSLRIARFLGVPLEKRRMAEAVDPR